MALQGVFVDIVSLHDVSFCFAFLHSYVVVSRAEDFCFFGGGGGETKEGECQC